MRPAVLLLCFCFLASCAGFPNGENPLLGEWRYADGRQTCQYVFRRDGTFSGRVAAGDQLLSQFTGDWQLQGNAILYLYKSDKLGRIPAGTRDRDKVIAIAADHFEIEATDGSRRTYRRVK